MVQHIPEKAKATIKREMTSNNSVANSHETHKAVCIKTIEKLT